jgi:hypothetical protein
LVAMQTKPRDEPKTALKNAATVIMDYAATRW